MAPGVLTARDVEIARWVARMGPVTVFQVARRFAMNRIAAYRRVRVLRAYGYLQREFAAHRRPGVLVATALAEDLDERATAVRALAPHQVAMHLAAVNVAVEHELAGTPVLVANELAAHPGLEERLPTAAAGPLRPELLVLTEPLLCVFAPSGAARGPVYDALIAASWPPATTGLLLVDEQREIDDLAAASGSLEVLRVDLTMAGHPPESPAGS